MISSTAVEVDNWAVPQNSLICIIDDDDSLRVALVGLVRSLGYRAEGFPNAAAFLSQNAWRDADCVVTDIHMPGLSGIELRDRLKAEGCAAPVIMVTARTEPALREQAFASGATCVLQKPFSAEALIDCLQRALANKSALR